MIKYLTIFTLMLAACCSAQKPIPAELPDGIRGFVINCADTIDCSTKTVGLCKNGYVIIAAEHTYKHDDSIFKQVIVCKDVPTNGK